MTVRHADGHGRVVLPADYVAEHVELGYASTAYTTQGRTVDTAHVLVAINHDPGGPLRGGHPGPGVQPPLRRRPTRAGRGGDDPRSGRAARRARRAGRRRRPPAVRTCPPTRPWPPSGPRRPASSSSPRSTRPSSPRRARHAGRRSWTAAACRLRSLAEARRSIEWSSLLGALRDADNRGLDVEAVLPQLATGRPIQEGKDPAAVLRARLHRWEQAARRTLAAPPGDGRRPGATSRRPRRRRARPGRP